MPEQTRTLDRLNNGAPLVVVRLPDGRLGIIHEAARLVWIEYDLEPTRVQGFLTLPRVALPDIGYGEWKATSIGGVSRTMRLTNLLRAVPKAPSPVTLFALHAPTADAARAALEGATEAATGLPVATVGDAEHDPTYGFASEVVVHEADDVARVAARLARVGIQPVFETPALNAQRCLGIERLDRIDAKVVVPNDHDEFGFGEYGLRRGTENWRFPWLPDGWQPPLTWDHMVANLAHVPDAKLHVVPQPLRQHMAKARLLEGGGEERARALRRHLPPKRLVSAGLTPEQSKQLLTVFYLLTVECVTDDPVLVRAMHLLSFRYALERGYMARWVGRYSQQCLHTGNGATLRRFSRLSQYDPHRLPAQVLNRLLTRDGKIRPKGAKASRSKYVAKAKRYRPKRRLVRSREEVARMAMA